MEPGGGLRIRHWRSRGNSGGSKMTMTKMAAKQSGEFCRTQDAAEVENEVPHLKKKELRG